jgi:dihydrofolate reductase
MVLHIATSEDGFIATEDDGLDWLPQPNEVEDFGMKAFMDTVDCVVMGRRTWEVAQTLEEKPFEAYDRHVCSRQTGRAEDLVHSLKIKPGGVIWLLGGGELNASLLEAGLIDTIVMTQIPVTLTNGIPLFGSLGTGLPNGWRPTLTKEFDGGIVQTTWVR